MPVILIALFAGSWAGLWVGPWVGPWVGVAESSGGGLKGETLTAYEQDGLWGYKHADGTLAIGRRFIVALEFLPEGIAPVLDEKGWAYINRAGEVLLRPMIFDNGPDYFSQGMARFIKDGKYGFFNRQGKVVIKPAFDFTFPFSDGLAVVCMGCSIQMEGEHSSIQGGRFGYIDVAGNIVIPVKYEYAEKFKNGRGRVKANGKWMYLGRDGKPMLNKPAY